MQLILHCVRYVAIMAYIVNDIVHIVRDMSPEYVGAVESTACKDFKNPCTVKISEL